jgi:hypothetical protein
LQRGNAPPRSLLGIHVTHRDRVCDPAASVEDHRPIEIGDLARTQSGLTASRIVARSRAGKEVPSLLVAFALATPLRRN